MTTTALRISTLAALTFTGACVLGGSTPPDGGTGGSTSSDGGSGGSPSTGGAGDGGDTSSTGGSGGGGGSVPSCLPASEHDGVFAIEDDGLCLLAKYTAPFAQGFTIVPTWGRHGGPLTMTQSADPEDEITLSRWQLPGGATGVLSAQTVGPIDLAISQSPLYLNTQAIDLPGNQTLVAWAEFGGTGGEAILVSGTAVDARFDVAGFYQAVGIQKGNELRLAHTALTALEDALGTQAAGIYFGDADDQNVLQDAASLVTFGDSSGAVTKDLDGNVFATVLDFVNDVDKVIGFGEETMEPGEAATTGNELATLAQGGSAIAAIPALGADAGYLFFQPVDNDTFTPGDVQALRYASDGTTVTVASGFAPALTLVTAGTTVSLFSDDVGRLWLGVDTGEAETTFFVVDRVPE